MKKNGFKFFLVKKASDVPTYVELGAADIGVVGKRYDLKQEESFMSIGSELWKVPYVCSRGRQVPKRLNNGSLIRVASKYPSIAKKTIFIIKTSDRRDH